MKKEVKLIWILMILAAIVVALLWRERRIVRMPSGERILKADPAAAAEWEEKYRGYE